MAQVAHRAGITRPAIHYHFPSKRALYQHVTQACYRTLVAPAVNEAEKERTLAQQVAVFTDVAGRGVAQDPSAAAFLSTAAAERPTWPHLRDHEHDPITTVRAIMTRTVRAAAQRGELHADLDDGPLIEMLVALLCGVWVYIGYLGPEHGDAITSTLHRLVTGRLSTLMKSRP